MVEIQNSDRETVVEVPSGMNRKDQPDFHVKLGDSEWRIGRQICEDGDRVVISCENPDNEFKPIIKVVRRDLLETWQKEAPQN